MPPNISWQCSLGGCELDNTHFTSAPLAVYNPAGFQCWMHLDGDAVENVPYGRMTIHVYPISDARLQLIFRHGNNFGYPWAHRHYRVIFTEGSRTELWRYDAPGWFFIGDWPGWWTLGDWVGVGILWWHLCSLDAIPAFGVQLAVKENDEWLVVGNVIDPLNKWADASVNRVALSMYDGPFWIDDFELHALPPPTP